MDHHPYAPPGPPPLDDDGDRAAAHDAKVALVLSVLALFVCAPVVAPIALWKATRARNVVVSWPSTVAIGIATLSLAVSIVFWLLATWQYVSPR